MSETNVGANLVFALRTTIVCEPMPEAYVSNSFSNIGLILVFVRRANIRFAPTLVLLIGLILVFVRGEHKVRPTRRITKYILRSTRKFDARSQALPGNVFLAALPPVQFVGGRATSENVPRQSLGTSLP